MTEQDLRDRPEPDLGAWLVPPGLKRILQTLQRVVRDHDIATVFVSLLGSPPQELPPTESHKWREKERNAETTEPARPELEEIVQAIRRHGYATRAAEELNLSYGALTWKLRRAGLTVRDVLSGPEQAGSKATRAALEWT